ncbi:MAG: hypothetical protein IJC49_01385 [Clostridia bacterium]|nr:hypothetical protein [Clostridia bacterium]
MSIREKSEKHWFTAADALIVVIVMSLLIGSVVLFLFPKEEKTTAVPVEASMIVHFDTDINGIKAGDSLFSGETAIGSVQKVDKAANNVVVIVNMEKDGGVYLFEGKPVRINGVFTLETRLCKLVGVVSGIGDKEE